MAALLGSLLAGCGEGSPEAAAADSSVVTPRMVPALSGLGDAATQDIPTCVRGGTPREDVRRILGEPDSISFGVWLYGASEVAFGYGVVIETRDRDGRLKLCD